MSGGRGVDAIGGPVLRRAFAREVVEPPLERHERRSCAAGDALGCGATLVEFRKPLIVHRAAAEHERLEHDEPRARQGAPGLIEQGGVLILVVLDGAGVTLPELVPEIVHADQDAQRVRGPSARPVWGRRPAPTSAPATLTNSRRVTSWVILITCLSHWRTRAAETGRPATTRAGGTGSRPSRPDRSGDRPRKKSSRPPPSGAYLVIRGPWCPSPPVRHLRTRSRFFLGASRGRP